MTFGLRGNRVWNGGSCSWISTPFSHFPPALFLLFSWIPFFCVPSTLVQSLIAPKPYKCMMKIFWIIHQYDRMEGKKWKKWWEGFFPPPSLLPPPRCFFLLTFLCTSSSIWTSSTDFSLGLEDSSDLREQSWDHCTVSHNFKFNWSNNFEINNRCKKLEQLLVVLGPRAHSWHPVVTVGL